MALQNNAALLIFIAITFCVVSVSAFAKVFVVGEADGWTVGPDYKKWAEDKEFSIGDILTFNYEKGQQDVLRVNKENFDSCDTSSRISSYASGQDLVTLMEPGEYYFICGKPGHCQGGQKFSIHVA
ncbi:hypothetical protein JCGZ_16516 [Jatropha curcas]|uniref:Phytocyanin domain-containing protein n=1 Tax=Jatropha curcas TaxID=180498 RepID=A0A067JZ03_JATCU|nr:mavicyanin-like [Jatropha curcas]KDP29127.1 hypothetical protein JCGZ_16516 [Jatropha curcas]